MNKREKVRILLLKVEAVSINEGGKRSIANLKEKENELGVPKQQHS